MLFILIILAGRMAIKNSCGSSKSSRVESELDEEMPLSMGSGHHGYNPEQDIVVVGQYEQDVGAEYGETI
jgi:hypothetical protein